MWELDCEESRVPKNWCFWTVVLEMTLETGRRSNQSILKEISPGCSLEGQMLKLKLQYFGHLMRRVDSLEKTLMLGGIAGRRRRGRQRMRWLDGITDSMGMSLSNSGSWWWTGRPGMLRFMGSQSVGHDWATELSWTETESSLSPKDDDSCIVLWRLWSWKTDAGPLAFPHWYMPFFRTLAPLCFCQTFLPSKGLVWTVCQVLHSVLFTDNSHLHF